MPIFKGEQARKLINRKPSPLLAWTLPWFSVVLASFLPALPFVPSAPIIPPVGFLSLLAWRQLRPGLLPVWSGLPLGIIDDLYSGQPLGSAIFLWSAAIIVLDIVETRLPWRNFLMEWLVAAALIVAYIVLGLVFANMAGGSTGLPVILPQILLSILAYPVVARLVAMVDRMRLLPFMEMR